MHIEQLYTNCLAQAAYYVESDGEVAIIDPIRDYDFYLKKGKDSGHRIRYIIETHFHADFVSGHIDLAKACGAEIVYGPGAETSYPVRIVADGSILPLGKTQFKVLHTPGHTPESSCFLLQDASGKDHALFSGDTLFVGDVGRPDLLESGGKYSGEQLAGMLYNSLRVKILPLSDDVLLYPAHGPGSSCGKNLGPETYSTLGAQKESNYALQDMSREEFVEALLRGITPPPQYFSENARLNKQGYSSLQKVKEKGNKRLNISELKELLNQNVLIIDTRIPDHFEQGFVPGSINIGLNGQYAIWAASLFPLNTPIALITEPGKEEESIIRLARVGFDKIVGVLNGGYEAWKAEIDPVDMVISVDAYEFSLDMKFESNPQVLDVRKKSEFDAGHLAGAQNIPLDQLQKELKQLNPAQDYYVYCAGGYRSMIAASLLKANGIHRLKNVLGGYNQIAANPEVKLSV